MVYSADAGLGYALVDGRPAPPPHIRAGSGDAGAVAEQPTMEGGGEARIQVFLPPGWPLAVATRH
jgi:hypothetical protein